MSVENKKYTLISDTVPEASNSKRSCLKKNCLNCGKEFDVAPYLNQKFCCRDCHYSWATKKLPNDSKICNVCGKSFTRPKHMQYGKLRFITDKEWSSRKCCSLKCSNTLLRKKSNKKQFCVICGKSFYPNINHTQRKLCGSPSCLKKYTQEYYKNFIRPNRVYKGEIKASVEKICIVCGEKFFTAKVTGKTSKKFCSKKCRNKYFNDRHRNYQLEWHKEDRRSHVLIIGRKTVRGLNKRTRTTICEICNMETKNIIAKSKYSQSRIAYHHWNNNNPSLGVWVCYKCHHIIEPIDDLEYCIYKDKVSGKIKKYLDLKEKIKKNRI